MTTTDIFALRIALEKAVAHHRYPGDDVIEGAIDCVMEVTRLEKLLAQWAQLIRAAEDQTTLLAIANDIERHVRYGGGV